MLFVSRMIKILKNQTGKSGLLVNCNFSAGRSRVRLVFISKSRLKFDILYTLHNKEHRHVFETIYTI